MTIQSPSFPSGTCIIINHSGSYSGSAVVSVNEHPNPAFLDHETIQIQLLRPISQVDMYQSSVEYIENNIYKRFKIIRHSSVLSAL